VLKQKWLLFPIMGVLAVGVFLIVSHQGKAYRVGLLYPQSGENARLGESVRQAAELAELNANATLFKDSLMRMKLVFRDTQGRPSIAKQEFLALADIERVPVVVGSLLSNDTQNFIKDADERKVVVLANGASSPHLRDVVGYPGSYIFRNWPSDDAEGVEMAEYARQSLSLRSGACLVAKDAYALGLANAFEQRFRALGGDLVTEQYNVGESDFLAVVQKLSRSQPEFVYVVGFPAELGHIVREVRRTLGPKKPILSAVGIESDEFFRVAGDAADNIFYTAPYVNPGSPEFLDFQEAYRKRYKENPDITASVTYDAVMLVAHAIAESGYSADAIKDHLHKVRNYPGTSGDTTFTEIGDVRKPTSIKRIEKGKSYLLEVYGK
jgi:branched-chain amino acid transport system substrate-binding protein